MVEGSRSIRTTGAPATRRWAERAREAWHALPARRVEIAVAAFFGLLVAQAMLRSRSLGVALVLALLAGVVLLRRPVLLVYSIIALIPLQWLTLLGERLRAISFLSLAAFAFFTLQSLTLRRPMGDRIVTAYLVFLGACALSLVASVDVSVSLDYLKPYLFALLFGYAALLALREERHVVVVARVLTLWGALLSVLALLQSLVSTAFFPAYHFSQFSMESVAFYEVSGIPRAAATFESGPRFCAFLLLPFALSAAAFAAGPRRWKWAHVGLLALFVAALVMTFTRAALILMVLLVALVFLLENRGLQLVRGGVVAALVAGALGIILYQILPDPVLAALAERFEATGSGSYKDRFYLLWNAANAFLEHPLTGLGIGTYTYHSWDLMQRFPVPWRSLRWEPPPFAMPDFVPVHNAYARILAETGIFGFGAYAAIFCFTIANYVRVLRATPRGPLRRTALAFFCYFLAMIVYWWAHEYIIDEPFVAILPVLMSVVLARAAREKARAAGHVAQPGGGPPPTAASKIRTSAR